MWSVIPVAWLAGYAVAISAGTFWVIWHFNGRPGWPATRKALAVWLAMVSAAATCVTLVTIALAKWTWSPLMSNSYLSERIFTDLNGTWEGTLHSIYTNPITGQPTTQAITAWIQQDFFGATMTLEPAEKTSRSETIVFWPRKEGATQQVLYIFKARVDEGGPVFFFLGAATGEIKSGPPLAIEGHYWTDRDWEHKKSTAGTFVLKRKSKEIVVQ
jgi:hypothetical protein